MKKVDASRDSLVEAKLRQTTKPQKINTRKSKLTKLTNKGKVC